MTTSPALFAALIKHGWIQHVAEGVEGDAVVGQLDRVGNLLGTRIGGRAGALTEVVRPQTVNDAAVMCETVFCNWRRATWHKRWNEQSRKLTVFPSGIWTTE